MTSTEISQSQRSFSIVSAANIAEGFASYSLSPVTPGSDPITAYYLDLSGRSRFRLKLKLKQNYASMESEFKSEFKSEHCNDNSLLASISHSDSASSSPLRLEVKLLNTEGTKTVTVESISLLTTSFHKDETETAILLEAEVVVRAFNIHPIPTSSPSFQRSQRTGLTQNVASNDDNETLSTRLELCAVLVSQPIVASVNSHPPGLLALELGGGGSLSFQPSHHIRSQPVVLTVNLTSALCVSVRNVSGSSGGSTLVALTIQHSNTHSKPVTITNIALHPGHSRLDVQHRDQYEYENANQSMPGGEKCVTDMSPFVKWAYVPRTEPHLPLTLLPHEAYSTVMTVDAGEDLRSRSFLTPISVTADVGETSDTYRPNIVVSTDAHWTTGRIAVEPADAFRIDMNVAQQFNYVGAPLVVTLRVLNLSTETRDLMLLMAKDDDKIRTINNSNNNTPRQQSGAVNTAVVSEVNGYTFGVWGLSGDDDGTTRHNRDHELLAVDAALLLGEVKGQHSVDAELRFVPLREGTLDVPNLKLYDKTEGKWYNCVHKLQIVAAAKKTIV